MRKPKKPVPRRPEGSREPQKRGDAVREVLVSACDRLLEANHPSTITTAMLLAEAGVARGTLYHHFKSGSALIERTLLNAFSRHVDANITALRALAEHSRDQAEFTEGLRQVTKISQSSARKDTRFARTRLIAYSETSASLRKMLAREQERLTTAIEAIVVTSQNKGWVKRSIKPRAAAVLIQAYTLGKIVDDVAKTRMPESDWNALIDEVVISGMLVQS